MISIIICSRSADSLLNINESIKNTIGVIYEIIAVDNSHGKYGICEAYNVGAMQAQYSLLCFMHEDIKFHTPNWGKVVFDVLYDPTVGVLGVTGGMYQVNAPAPWWGCGTDLCRENVLNVFPDGHTEMELRNPEANKLVDVAVVDGMWLCTRREIWQLYPFDSQAFTDFHFYDVDYCTEVFNRGYRVCVTYEILLEHHSRGSLNVSWLHNALKYQSKWFSKLPFGVVELTNAQRNKLELRALQEFTGRIIRANFPKQQVISFLMRCLRISPFNRDNLWLVKYWLSNN